MLFNNMAYLHVKSARQPNIERLRYTLVESCKMSNASLLFISRMCYAFQLKAKAIICSL